VTSYPTGQNPPPDDIRDTLSYISDAAACKESKKELFDCETSLRSLHVGDSADKSAKYRTLEEIRYRIEQLSRAGAEQRDSHWRKVNLLRVRLIVMSGIIATVLLSLLILIPFIFDQGVTLSFVLTVILLGALGGLVSALSTIEPLGASSSGYYINRILLFLKPVIGAAAGLVVYLLQLSNLVQVATASANPPATYLATAFLAGFSERFFTSELQKIPGIGGKKNQ